MTATLVMLVAQAWVSPALGATTNCKNLHERTLDLWHTLDDDDTRAAQTSPTFP